MNGALRVQVGILEIQAVVVGFRQGIVDGCVQKIECAAAGGQLHVGIDRVVCLMLDCIERIRIVPKAVKGDATDAQRLIHHIGNPL